MIRTSPFATPSELKGRSVEHQWLLTEKRETVCFLVGKHMNLKKTKRT